MKALRRTLIEIEDIKDSALHVAISRRSFDGWNWAKVAQELGRSKDAVKKSALKDIFHNFMQMS